MLLKYIIQKILKSIWYRYYALTVEFLDGRYLCTKEYWSISLNRLVIKLRIDGGGDVFLAKDDSHILSI